ncbi:MULTISPECIES: DinB family protein [unclassified Frankia]|uniref:DinB family protein n=1 Tax=unclassified Frankia TaxID=2632575 RepID=UPI001304545E|nr:MULTISPECIES: DinB family protein [unclassified Frankia]
MPLTEVAGRLTALVAVLAERLVANPVERLRARHMPGWTALEYAGHTADVLELFARRVAHLLAADEPELEVIDHDALVAAGRHNDRTPDETADRLRSGLAALTAELAGVTGPAWDRGGTRAGERRTVRETAYRAAHELIHHGMDIDRRLGPDQAK